MNQSQVGPLLSARARCVVTGCALVHGERWVAGDLFECGGCYVFNGNVDQYERPKWLDLDSCHYVKRLEPPDWFERRGVFVVPKEMANLNQAAIEYIGT